MQLNKSKDISTIGETTCICILAMKVVKRGRNLQQCVIKLPGATFDDPTPPFGSLRGSCVYTAARRLDYCTQEAVLSQQIGLDLAATVQLVDKANS